MSLARKILSNTFWQVLGRFLAAVLGIISIKIITNYLPTDIYGQYTTLYEYIGFFAIAADFGLYTIGVREMSKKEKSISEILANIIAIRSVLIISMLGIACIIAQLIPKYAGTYVSQGIWLVAITTGFSLLTGTLSSVLQYKLKMVYATIALTIGKILNVGFIALTIYVLAAGNIETGFTYLLYAGVIASIFNLLLIILFVSKHTKVYVDFNWKYTKELVIKSLPLGLSLVLSTIYFKIDVVLLGLIQDYTQVGIYGVSLKFMEILGVIPVFFMNSALPAITESFNKNKERFQMLITKSWKFLFTLAVPIAIGGALLAFPLTFAIASPQFLTGYHCANNAQIVYQSPEEASAICPNVEIREDFTIDTENPFEYRKGSDIALRLILVAMVFAFLNTLFAFSLVAMEKQTYLLIVNLIGVIFNVTTNLIFIPKYGFEAAAITTILSELIILIGTYVACRKLIEIRIPWLTNIKVLFSGALMGVVVYYLKAPTYNLMENFNILILIPIGGLVYLGGILGTKTFTTKEIKEI